MFRRCQIRSFPALDEFLGIIMKVQHQNDFTARASLLAVLGKPIILSAQLFFAKV